MANLNIQDNALNPGYIPTPEKDVSKMIGKESADKSMATNVNTQSNLLDPSFTKFLSIIGSKTPATQTDTSSPVTTGEYSTSGTIKPPVLTPDTTKNDKLNNIGEETSESAQTAIDDAKKAETTPRDDAVSKYLDINKQISGYGTDKATQQKKQDISGKTEALNKINNEILVKTRAKEKELREFEKNSAGMGGGALAQGRARISKARNEELADLAVQKAVALGDLETANTIVQQTLDAKYEPLESQLKNWETLIGIYQNDMSESEKFEAQNKLSAQKEEATYLKNLQTALINDANTSGQTGVASKAMLLDPASPTFKQDLANLQAQVVKTQTGAGEMTTRQNIVYNSLMGKYSTIDKANSTFEVVKSTSDALRKDPKNAQLQLSTLYQYVKVLDSNSAVREGETKLAKDTASFYNKVQASIQGIIDGTVTGSDVALKMATEAERLAQDWLNASSSQKNILQAQAKANGIEDIYKETIDYAGELGSQTQTPATTGNDEATFDDVLSQDTGYWSKLWGAIKGK